MTNGKLLYQEVWIAKLMKLFALLKKSVMKSKNLSSLSAFKCLATYTSWPPEQYLYQGDKHCYFILAESKLTGKNRDIYIMGDAFLKHFYSAFDFDKNEVSLGINTHSKDKVKLSQQFDKIFKYSK